MLRPSYNEQILGFGFVKTELAATVTSTTPIWGDTIDTYSEVIPNIGQCLFSSATKNLSVLNDDQAGVGVLAPMNTGGRECYTFSMNGIAKGLLTPFGFVGTLEIAHVVDTIQSVRILALLPIKTFASAEINQFSCEGFVRPNVDVSTYTNIASVTGLMFGIGFANITGGTITSNHIISFEVQRWVDPEVNIRTPVV